MDTIACECSEEYGPCETHGETVAQREGGSNRSADELCVTYLEDALEIDPRCLSPYGRDVLDQALKSDSWEGSWLADPDLADDVRMVCDQVEAHLSPLWTVWEDGYMIYRVIGGPLAE